KRTFYPGGTAAAPYEDGDPKFFDRNDIVLWGDTDGGRSTAAGSAQAGRHTIAIRDFKVVNYGSGAARAVTFTRGPFTIANCFTVGASTTLQTTGTFDNVT